MMSTIHTKLGELTFDHHRRKFPPMGGDTHLFHTHTYSNTDKKERSIALKGTNLNFVSHTKLHDGSS